jgi:hypothetical protein
MVATSRPQKPYIPWYIRWELPALLPAVLLALLMVWSVVQSIANSNWANGLGILVLVALPALLVGVLFARLHWLSGWLAHLLSAALGIAWSVQQVGPLLVHEISQELGASLAERLVTWSDRASEILIRTLIWGRIIGAGGRGEDIVLFIVALALIVWAMSYITGWLLFRSGRAWWAVVLNAAIILINYTFAFPKPNTLFFVFLIAALLLIVHQQIVQQQRAWQSALIDYPEYMPWRFMVAAVLFCVAVVLVTSVLPGSANSTQVASVWRVMSSPLTAMRERWETAFSTINAPPGASGGGFTTRAVRAGGGRILSDAEVMRVTSSKYDYWRANAFDQYTGSGWLNNVAVRASADKGTTTPEQARTPIEAGVSLPQVDLQGRMLVTETVTLSQPRNDGLVMLGGQLLTPGLPVLIQNGFLQAQNGQLVPNFEETANIFSQLPLEAGQTYTVTALVSSADVQSLQAAGTDYPDWVRAAYLQLPTTVTDRTRALARTIVTDAGATNPYDEAAAIQNYLRRFVYDETRAAPPQDRDWADYFLFNSQRGYCDDFATSMVVLLRSLDIPARWVQGYAGGTLDKGNTYVVRESVAHSWPEVYFPGYGWQRFEPTPAAYAIIPTRPATPGDDTSTLTSTLNIPESRALRDLRELNESEYAQLQSGLAVSNAALEARQRAEQRRRLLIISSILVALVGGAALFWFMLRRELRGLSPAAAAYLRMGRLAGWAGLPQEQHATPLEYAAELRRNLPEQRSAIDRIVGAYIAERYRGARASTANFEQDLHALRKPLLLRMVSRLGGRRAQPERAARRRRV